MAACTIDDAFAAADERELHQLECLEGRRQLGAVAQAALAVLVGAASPEGTLRGQKHGMCLTCAYFRNALS